MKPGSPPSVNICCVSVQGLHPEKLLTSSAVVKCDGRAFGAFPGCVTRCFTLTSRFLQPRPAKVTICTTWCRYFLSFFLLFRARKESCDMWGHKGSWCIFQKQGKEGAFVGCIWRSLQIGTALWHNWPSNAPPKDADPEFRHSNCVTVSDSYCLSCALYFCLDASVLSRLFCFTFT